VSGYLLVWAAFGFAAALVQAALERAGLLTRMTHWREGRAGALRMGLSHGLYCVGCCWALMLLLFAVGVMNLVFPPGA
jgi:predicted metal-binding membrane protein